VRSALCYLPLDSEDRMAGPSGTATKRAKYNTFETLPSEVSMDASHFLPASSRSIRQSN